VVVDVVTLSVELPLAIGFGLNVPAAPAGNPLTVRVTDPLKPFVGVTVAVYVVPEP